jgi:hypothetical protein
MSYGSHIKNLGHIHQLDSQHRRVVEQTGIMICYFYMYCMEKKDLL